MSGASIVCDFCLASDPQWEYMAREHELPGDTLSIGSWCACDLCRLLIDADDRKGLARRAHNRVPIVGLDAIEQTQELFFRNRTSDAQPIRLTAIHGRIFET